MKSVTVTFTDGETIKTRINGSNDTIREYYAVGSQMNVGSVQDNYKTIEKVEIHE